MKMSYTLTVCATIFAALLLSSCASLQSGDQHCRRTDWHRLGSQDGMQGKDKRNLTKDFADCGPNFSINQAAYKKGWDQGVKLYCGSRNGLSLGMAGKQYNNVCPDNQISAFDKAWKEGLRDYCTPGNGYALGRSGKPFAGFCAPDLNVAFKKAYDQGHQAYQKLSKLYAAYEKLDKEVKNIQSDIQSKEKVLKELEYEFAQQPFSPQKQYRLQKDKLFVKKLAIKADHVIQQRNSALQKYNDLDSRRLKTENGRQS